MARKSLSGEGISLGIGQLPTSAALMQSGRPYAVTANNTRTRNAFIAGLIAHSLKQDRKVTWLAGAPPEPLLQLLGSHQIQARAEIAEGRLQVLIQSPQPQDLLALHGATRLLDEIDEFCDARRGLVVIAPADGLLDLAHRRQADRQAQAYAHWCRERSATAVLVFDGDAESPPLHEGLQALDGWFAGLAHLRGDSQRPHWGVEHWRAPEGSLIHRRYGLSLSPDGALLVANGGEIAARESKILAAPDHDAVYATAGSVSGARGLPERWQIIESAAELLDKATQAVAATFVLDFERGSRIELAARLIHDLRQRGGNGIKIVVRQRGAGLRYNHETLLLRLGANSVIDASLSDSRFLAAVDALRDQVFTRELPPDFDSALRLALPPAAGGYLPPREFCKAVGEAIERGAAIGLRSVLLRLVIQPQLSHLEVLRRIRLQRPGDLFSADDRSVYLFLFACREPDIDTALDLVVTAPLDSLFEGQIRWIEDDVLRNAVDSLERRLRHVATADFGPLLQQTAAPPPAHAAAAPVAPAELAVTAAAAPASVAPLPSPSHAAPAARRIARVTLAQRPST